MMAKVRRRATSRWSSAAETMVRRALTRAGHAAPCPTCPSSARPQRACRRPRGDAVVTRLPSPLRPALLALAALSRGCATTQRSDAPAWTDVEDPSVERPTTEDPGEVDPVAASEAKAE